MTTINVPEVQEAQHQSTASQMLDMANGLAIVTADDYQLASTYLTANKKMQKALDEDRKSLLAPLREAVDRIGAKYKPFVDQLVQAEGIIKGKVQVYLRAEEDRRRKEQAEAEERARKERARLEAQAAKAQEKGQDEKAQQKLDQAATVVAAPVAAAPVAKGVASRKVWTGQVVDAKAVCKLIADGQLPVSIIEFKQGEINRLASQWKNTATFEGLRFTEDFQIAAGRK